MQNDGCYSIIIDETALEKIEEKLTDFEDYTIEDTLVTKETLELSHKILEKQDFLTGKVFCFRLYMEGKLEGGSDDL